MSADWAAVISVFVGFMIVLWLGTAWVVFLGTFTQTDGIWWQYPLAMTGLVLLAMFSVFIGMFLYGVMI